MLSTKCAIAAGAVLALADDLPDVRAGDGEARLQLAGENFQRDELDHQPRQERRAPLSAAMASEAELVARLTAWVSANAGYPVPDRRPRLEWRGDGALEVRLDGSDKPYSAARGSYRDGSATILLHESLRDLAQPRARALLVHEIAHYLQDLSGRWPTKTCRAWLEREREAIRLQFAYLVGPGGCSAARVVMPAVNAGQCPQRAPGRGAAALQ
jgi:hypothetical protein